MRLQHQLVLPQARIKKVKIELGAEEHKVALEIRTALTQEVAESFGCRELIYAGNVPRSGVEKMDLEGSEIDCDVHLKHDNFAFSTVVEEMGKYVAKMEGTGPELSFQIKFKGYVITVADLIEHVKIDPLEVTLKPAQMNLGVEDGPALPEETPTPPLSEPTCSSCESGVALLDDTLMHADGHPCIARQSATSEEADGPALASVVEMGGSHQRGTKKQQKKRKPEPAEEDADILEEMGVPGSVQ